MTKLRRWKKNSMSAPINSIDNLKIGEAPFLCFKWKIQRPNSQLPWTQKTPNMSFHENSKEDFSLIISMNHSSIGYSNRLCPVKFDMYFSDNRTLFQDVYFQVVIYFNNNSIGHYFKLRMNEKDRNLFQSSFKDVNDEYLYYSRDTYDAFVEIYYRTSVNDNSFSLLSKNLGQLLSDQSYADLKVKVGDQSYDVHKCILTSRSRVIAKMIEAEMIEKEKSEINLHDTEPTVVEELLCYIYTGQCNIDKAPHELFKLAHFLELPELQSQCKRFLLYNIDMKNIIATMALTNHDQYELSELESATRKFIEANEAVLVKNSEFKDLLKSSLKVKNITFILKIANKYKLEDLLLVAIEFIRREYAEVLQNDECRNFLLNHPKLLLEMYIHTMDVAKTAASKSQ
ncbi:hypothetical protein QAD02_006236 [Eretmocerus hayati]|uniref:Uncharacterized protein n=1 Tax=Eretmocerus hayati TaxID=131215 RepID=A0ACC2N0N8_9HYME|nr:hypothetical protein QAD02_006236 [Eretmocerus hayati]